jgi:hypothetical protein
MSPANDTMNCRTQAPSVRGDEIRSYAAIRSETRVFSPLSDAVFKRSPLARCQVQSMLGIGRESLPGQTNLPAAQF